MNTNISIARVPLRARPGDLPASHPSLRGNYSRHLPQIRGHVGYVVVRQRINGAVVFSGDLKARDGSEFPLGLSTTPRLAFNSESGLSCSVSVLQDAPAKDSKAFQNNVPPDVFFKLRSHSECAKTISESEKRLST